MKILNIAHRGYSGKFDENTMTAFKKAIEYGADGIETDVQLSKDGVPVIIHDETLDRTTDGHGFVKDYTLSELKKFRTVSVGHAKELKEYMQENYTDDEIKHFTENAGEEIPTLEELLEMVSQSDLKLLNLELKNSIIEYEGLEEKVLYMIEKYNLKDRVIISTFNHLSLMMIRNIDSEVVLGALTETTLANVPRYLKDINVQCYHPYFKSILNKEYMKEIKDTGIKVNPYTINTEADIKAVIEVGVDSIITNEVETVNKILSSMGSK
ncbi:glycerophosphodiester phosphodiesterase [uncultured Clostridium sp.]|uniref:glycerophosphodiester phosphodiesterase n=1 Tax=uncultured Clostridium sp. TaxID=59620 RepID=UPI0025FE14BB|nr:glycerophosphodiester phosphodiesterase [uncultured Clostridium sp.]